MRRWVERNARRAQKAPRADTCINVLTEALSSNTHAQVAELAYAPGLEPGARKGLWVQLPPCAPRKNPMSPWDFYVP